MLIVLANVQMKVSSQAFTLVDYLSISKFKDVSPGAQSILAACIYHKCLSTIIASLKLAYLNGHVTSDPWGVLCVIHTPLAAWIADYPEQLLISCLASKQSSFSTEGANNFGNAQPHSIQTANSILTAIAQACSKTPNVWNLNTFAKTCKRHCLNGVLYPFWHGWGDAEPSSFLTPDALHKWHKFFFDHVIQWAINLIGGDKLDFCLQVL